MVTWVGVPTKQFEIVAGEELLSGYASSQDANRRFCSRCGSSLFFESTRWPDEVHVAVANLEAPPDLKVQAHVFFDDRANWLHVSDELPRLGGESGTEPLG